MNTDDNAPEFLPYGRQLIEDDDIAAVVDVLRGNWLTQGPAVDAFEADLAATVGARHAVACSSGTAALHLAMLAAEIGPNDTVIVPANTFLATANAVRLCGSDVMFADVDPDTGLMTPGHLEQAVSAAGNTHVRAAIPVHYAGQMDDLVHLRATANKHDLMLIEDACHALGTDYTAAGQTYAVGACAHTTMAAFSFHPVKTVAMGEGGAVTTNDDTLAARLRLMRNHGMVRDVERFEQHELAFGPNGGINPWYYEMPEPGLNYRASGLHCALGRSQLAKLHRFVSRRRALVARYDNALAALEPVVKPLARTPNNRPAWHLYVILIDFNALSVDRAEFMSCLREKGIGCQVHYIPVPWQPYYAKRYPGHRYPGAEEFYARCLSLPLFAAMTDADVDRVLASLADVLESAR